MTNHAHANFQLPVNVLVEDPKFPLTQYKRISSKEIKKDDRYGTYSKIIKVIKHIQDAVSAIEGLLLQKDLTVEFALDINKNLWMLNAFSKEYADFGGLEDEYDYNEKYFLKAIE